MKQFIYILLLVFALAITLLVRQVIPHTYFDAYVITLDSVWEKPKAEQEYWVDINNDKVPEKFRHHDINLQGNSIELWRGKKLNQIYIFKDNEKFISNTLKFADIDGDSIRELLFVSEKKDSAYLNILAYKAHTQLLYPIRKIAIEKIKLRDGKTDVVNNFIETSGASVYFDLQAGYTVQPRNIYNYNFDQNTILKTRRNGLVIPELIAFEYKDTPFLLASYVKATSNTLSHIDAEIMRSSTNKDTFAMYEKYKHLEYEYGDFSSYILVYNDSMQFAFEPVEFFGWTNFTKSVLMDIDNEPYIIALTNAQLDEQENKPCKTITICDLHGKIKKQIPLPHNYTDVFCDNNRLVFYGEKSLYVADNQLETNERIDDVTHAHGFVDMNNDTEVEFVAFRNNVLTVFSSDFETLASFTVEQEFAPYPENNCITCLQTDSNNVFIYNSRLFYYQFSYTKNDIAFLEYPFLASVFLLAFGVLFLVSRINSKRLENENLKLEQIVTERTQEIASQKEEIQLQANELEQRNIHLLELSKFKKLMTNTVIHDLKNPLNYIIGNTNDKVIRQSGYTMLNIVLNVLDIDKAQSTQLQLNITKQSAENLIDTAISQVEYLAEQKNLTFEKLFPQEFEIKADKDLTVRIVVNLLTNAIKYSPLNSKVTIRAAEHDGGLKIDVVDYGKGIASENLASVFDEYTQIEAKSSGNIASTGIGLTFCKIAARAQGVQILVNSVPEQQTCFSLIFPLASVTEKTAELTSVDIAEMQLTDTERRQIRPILRKLKETKIYEATEILKLLSSIENPTVNVNRWCKKLKTAMFASNHELYNQLIDNELQNTDN